jgi:Helix-turn-helix domain
MAERPEYLTVPEVMARLRLGRTTVYEQARLYLATNGAEGIPCRRFGRSLRFPAAAFDASGGAGATRNEAEVVDPAGGRNRKTPPPPDPHPRSARRRRRTARRPSDDDQVTLPFTR